MFELLQSAFFKLINIRNWPDTDFHKTLTIVFLYKKMKKTIPIILLHGLFLPICE